MSRSASHTSLASFGPGNPNPYASKPKQRVRPKQPEPPKRPATALASPDAAKKTEVKDGELPLATVDVKCMLARKLDLWESHWECTICDLLQHVS